MKTQEVKKIVDEVVHQHETRFHKRTRSVFTPPTIKEIDAYCIEKGIDVVPEYIWNFYEKKGWKVGKTLMVSWRSAVSQAKYWTDAPRRKMPTKIDPKAEAAALEKLRQKLRDDDEGQYYRGETTEKLQKLLANPKALVRHWLIKEILTERRSND